MILSRLVQLYDRMAEDPEHGHALARPGFSLQKVSFRVVLNPDGTLNQFASMLELDGKRTRPRDMLLPGQAKPSGSGINPCFLWDNAAYMLGYKPDDPKPDRTRETFAAFRQRHLDAEAEVNAPAYSAVCRFLESWQPEAAGGHEAQLKDVISHFGVFQIAGGRFVHDDPAVLRYLAGRHAPTDGTNGAIGTCSVTGEVGPIARLHEPKIKGVRGAQSSGATLVSFNDPAYESFGNVQGANAGVGESATFKYCNALNHLLSRRDRHVLLGDMTVVFWAERPDPLEDAAADLFADSPPPDEDALAALPAEDRLRAQQVQTLLNQLREGYADREAVSDQGVRFYVLGLAPNASRVSVRFWHETSVEEMKRRLARHMRDVSLVGGRFDQAPLMLRRIVQAAGRAETDARGHLRRYDEDAAPPTLAGALAQAVLTGGPYPQLLLNHMLNRMKADGQVNHTRVAAVKGCLVRNHNLEVPVALNLERTDPAYVTGRLFALLEKIQSDSLGGELNATIKDRYFSAASATPALVFPRLIRLSQHHLAKLEGGPKV
ncbi:MAG: type I-C CRISPR-associated protein Cas8c/Csd1, partial [Phycisphaerae bacterium]